MCEEVGMEAAGTNMGGEKDHLSFAAGRAGGKHCHLTIFPVYEMYLLFYLL